MNTKTDAKNKMDALSKLYLDHHVKLHHARVAHNVIKKMSSSLGSRSRSHSRGRKGSRSRSSSIFGSRSGLGLGLSGLGGLGGLGFGGDISDMYLMSALSGQTPSSKEDANIKAYVAAVKEYEAKVKEYKKSNSTVSFDDLNKLEATVDSFDEKLKPFIGGALRRHRKRSHSRGRKTHRKTHRKSHRKSHRRH